MKEDRGQLEPADELRHRAMRRARAMYPEPAAGDLEAPTELRRLVQELQIHQIELELQNDELLRARAEAEHALARYTALYELAPVGYLSLDRHGGIRQVNLSASRLLGVERRRLLGMRLTVLIAAEYRGTFDAVFTRVLESRTKESCEVLVQSGNREAPAIEIVASASEDGTECRIITTDISQRRRAQGMLSIHLQLQQFAVEHSRNELLRMMLDECERMTGGQLGICYLLVNERRALVREAWSTRTDGRFKAAHDEIQHLALEEGAWADCAKQRRPIVCNLDALPARTTGIPGLPWQVQRAMVVPIIREDEIVALVGLADKATDFTEDDVKTVVYLTDVVWSMAEHKKAEDDRRNLQLQLQLADSQKMEAIGTLAGGIAHDFNNILAGILGGLTLIDLELSPVTEEASASIREMMELVHRGSDLTRQLLGFARRGKYDVRPLNLARVVTKTSAMFGRTRKEISIRLDLQPGLMAILMDRTQMEQVLLNLFVNAAQAMPQGGVLSVRAENVDRAVSNGVGEAAAPVAMVKLDVQDTGVGMDSETQARIFEPFFTTRGPGQGTGLGLASVYGIVKSHEGFISVKSALGKGTTFSVFLPATEHPTVEDKTPTIVIERGAGTILVVDDEPHILEILTRLLTKLGYDVLTASGGSEAVETVRQRGTSISLVILDMIMPEMSGSQTLDALQAVAPDIKVLVSSGYSMEEQTREMLARGCKGFIQKPFDVGTLSSTLKALV